MAFRASLRPLRDGTQTNHTLGLGCVPLGHLYSPIPESQAVATVHRALDRGVRFLDTAPSYGAGLSELRVGRALAGVDRDTVVVATKVGRRLVDGDGADVPAGALGADTVADLSRDGVLRSLEGSLARLGTDRIDVLYLHDPPDVDVALDTAIPAMADLRDQGIVRAIGVGMVWTAPLTRFVREAPIDVVMIAGRLTLLDRRAEEELLPAALETGVGVIAAGVFNSGILADPTGSPMFDYHPADAELVGRAASLAAVCRRHGVALPHAAAQYPLHSPSVEAVVIGARSPEEVDGFVDGALADIPDSLWPALEAG